MENLKVSGTISKESYLSIGDYMLSYRYTTIFIAVVVVLNLGLILVAWLLKDLAWLILALTLSLSALAFYRWNRKNIVNRVIATTPGIRDGKTFDLDISFDDDAIRVHNRMTDLTTALSYELFGSYAVTENCIAAFVKTGTYLLIPTTNVKESEKQQIIAILKEKCPGIRARRSNIRKKKKK